jgi:phosphopantothenoylcysteine decarboxylase / phosphopantothenate---cysteine ligase
MGGLNGRKIIVGVTGSIAAYKAAILVRELIKRGSEVRVAMTESASHFITPLTFASLSRHNVALSMFPSAGSEPESGSWHIDWAMWGDAMVIAPATASTIAKLATGISDNALTVIATALRGRLFVAPAMDLDMYVWPALARNLETLGSFGATIIPPEEGELASGLSGIGRLADPMRIASAIEQALDGGGRLKGRRVLVTAGPTHEPIDPVRYIANRSSGKMGYALAEVARDRGATVTMVSGPTALARPQGVEVIDVTTAEQMAHAIDERLDAADIVVAAAAVADFTPTSTLDRKLKRREMSDHDMKIELRSTRDILRSIGERRRDDQVIVGFALETASLLESARAKLVEKNCDIIVANSASEPGVGLASDVNRIVVISERSEIALPVMSKRECAEKIFDEIEKRLDSSRTEHEAASSMHG